MSTAPDLLTPKSPRARLEASGLEALRTLGQVMGSPLGRTAYFLLISLITVWPLLSTAGSMNSFRDEQALLPYEEAARRTVVEFHQLPLWNPYYCGGMDGLGTPQSRFAAPTFLLTLIFGTLRGQALAAFLMFYLGLEGTFRYARSRGATHLGAALAAPMFALSGYFANSIALGWYQFFGFELIPWAAYGLRRAIRGERRGVALVALSLAWIVGFGGTYPAPIAALWLAFELGTEIASAFSTEDAVERKFAVQRVRSAITITGIAAAFSLGVAAFRLWPVAYTLTVSRRVMGGAPGNHPLAILKALLFQISPDDSGEFPINGTFLIGGLCAVAVAAGLTRKRAAPLVVAAAVSIWLAAGYAANVSIFAAIKLLPVYSTLRYPERFLITFALAVAVLAAFGISHLQAMVARKKAWAPALLLIASFLLIANIGPLVANTHVAANLRGLVAPPEKADITPNEFHQARGTRWAAAYYPTLGRGCLSCYEAYPVPQSPLLRADLKQEEGFQDPSAGTVSRTSWTPNAISLDVDALKPGRIRVNQNWHAGWRTSVGEIVDEKGLLAIDVPAGKHTVTLRFLPREALGGLLVTLVALAALAYFCRTSARLAPPKPYEIALAFIAPLAPFAGTLALVHQAKPPATELKTASGEEVVIDALPANVQKIGVRFDGGLTLEGFSMSTSRPTAETTTNLSFYWRVGSDVKPRMGIFVKLEPSKGDVGKDSIIADHVMFSDVLPIESAPQGTIIRDVVRLTVPFDARGKDWTIYAGVWNVLGNGKRRAVVDANGLKVDENRVELEKFTVP